MSGSRAWSFVFYACGHQDPVRGGDRKVDRPCAACARYCTHCRQTSFRDGPFCSDACEREANS